MKRVYNVCPHDCPDTCGIITEVENGVAVKVSGDPNHPITQGWLCGKVRPYLDRVYHPDRLTHPLRRVGAKGGGQWQRIGWDEALAEIGERWRGIINEHGGAAILPYSYSGTLGMVQNMVAAARLMNRMGASQLQRSICGIAAETAVEATLGVRFSQPYGDVVHSKVVIVWGHNPVTTAPHFMPALNHAKRNGTQLIVIDPRRTKTAKTADWHIAPLPATDGALALGLAHIILREGWHDEAWLAENTVGWEQLRPTLANYPPEKVAGITGVPVADIKKLAQLYATNSPSLIKIADGLVRHANGGQTARSVLILPALTAQYGKKGGGLAYSASGVTQWHNETINHWQECPPPARTVNMNRLGAALLGEISDPPIQSLFVFNANPVAAAPNSQKIIAGLKRDDLFTVVHELFMTDTADYADILLPATSPLEHTDLHKAYGHTLLSYNAPAIPPLGEAMPNWQLMGRLATEMGYTDEWLHESEDAIIADLLAKSLPNNPHLAGITLERLKAEGSVPFNLSHTTPFADGYFPTPSGKIELACPALTPEIEPIPVFHPAHDDSRPPHSNGHFLPENALILISAAAHHFTSSSFANQDGLLKHEGDPFVEIHPTDAQLRDIANGDKVVVENKRGWAELTAKVTKTVRAGVLASPKGRWHKLSGGNTINNTTSDAIGDLAGQSTFHTNLVWVRKIS